MNESKVTTKLIQALNAIPCCFARKRHGNIFSAGDPDIALCYRGRTILIELKMPGGALSDLQAIMLDRWQAAGAVCVLGVWDSAQKAFCFHSNKSWKKYVGNIKSTMLRAGCGAYQNVRAADMQEVLDDWYTHNSKAH